MRYATIQYNILKQYNVLYIYWFIQPNIVVYRVFLQYTLINSDDDDDDDEDDEKPWK